VGSRHAGYLETLGQQIVRGRSITGQDTATSRSVAVVNGHSCIASSNQARSRSGAHFGSTCRATITPSRLSRVRTPNTMTRQTPSLRVRSSSSRSPATHYDDDIMQSVDDMTHFVEARFSRYTAAWRGWNPRCVTSSAM